MKIVSLVVAVVCFALAALYITGHGPAFGHDAEPHTKHLKHAIVFGVLGIAALLFMRMQNQQSQPA